LSVQSSLETAWEGYSFRVIGKALQILVTPAITENVLQFSCVELIPFLKTAVAFKAYSFHSLLFSIQRNLVGKLSLAEYSATGISLPFSRWEELHTK